MARGDLLRASEIIAARVTKGTLSCDRALHTLMCYVNSTVDNTMTGHVGKYDKLEGMEIHLYADAYLAGDRPAFKSTAGAYCVNSGPKHRLRFRG